MGNRISERNQSRKVSWVLTVARFVVSILFPGTHSPASSFWSSLFAATTLRKFKSAQRVSRLGAGRSWMRCWRASCCSRLFLISRKQSNHPLYYYAPTARKRRRSEIRSLGRIVRGKKEEKTKIKKKKKEEGEKRTAKTIDTLARKPILFFISFAGKRFRKTTMQTGFKFSSLRLRERSWERRIQPVKRLMSD